MNTSDTKNDQDLSSIAQFEYNFKVLEGHLDTFGHMNHATYLQIFEQARWEFITNHGWGVDRIQSEAIGPTILEVKIQYKRELKLRENIMIKSQVMPYKGKLTTIVQDMVNDKGDVCAHIELLIGVFDLNKRRLINPPDDWKSIGIK